MYTPKCQTEWGTWPQTILNHIIMFGLQILRHTHQVLYAWLNYGGISLLLSLEYLQPPTTSYFGRLSSRWDSFVFLFPQCLQSKSLRCEHHMHYQTSAALWHCAIRQVHFFFVFLPSPSFRAFQGQLPGAPRYQDGGARTWTSKSELCHRRQGAHRGITGWRSSPGQPARFLRDMSWTIMFFLRIFVD